MRDLIVSAVQPCVGIFFLIACVVPYYAQAEEPDGWAVNVYGLSYHVERGRAREIDADNELNPGVGIRKGLWNDGNHRVYVEGGIYYDSGRRWAKTADITYQYQLLKNLRAGAGVFFFYTPTYNRGDPVLAPLPVVSYDFGPVELNVAYAPKWRNLNDINTLGFWLSWKIR
jgi:hypothetical protein